MFRRFSTNFALLSIALDLVCVAAMLLLAIILRPWLGTLPLIRDFPVPDPVPLPLYIIFPVLWVMILLLLSVYDGRKNLRIVDEFSSLTLGALMASVFLAGILYLGYREMSRALFVAFSILTYLSMLTWRSLARMFFRKQAGKGVIIRRVLVVGAGPVGRELQAQIKQNPGFGLGVIGFLDDDPSKRDQEVEILGMTNDLQKVIREYAVDDVVFALPLRAYEKVNRQVAELHSIPVKVWVIPDYFHVTLYRATPEEFAGITMLDLRAPALSDYQRMMKRSLDLVISLVLMPFVLPIIGLAALAIRLDGPGPIFFKQNRVGENGRLFGMLKFRTMVPDAENLRHLVEHYDEDGNLIHKTEDDPRITRVGRFLRRTSIDELPQIFNILKGDMSLVGPRPELPHLVEMYEPWQRKRFAVPQGLTGWWQVNGRSDKPMHLNTEYDLYYVQNYSLLLDIIIIIKTIWVVLKGKGAY
jgi:exopolysaccharide biosynthesis polyprenyl glycosylphosphotransferase